MDLIQLLVPSTGSSEGTDLTALKWRSSERSLTWENLYLWFNYKIKIKNEKLNIWYVKFHILRICALNIRLHQSVCSSAESLRPGTSDRSSSIDHNSFHLHVRNVFEVAHLPQPLCKSEMKGMKNKHLRDIKAGCCSCRGGAVIRASGRRANSLPSSLCEPATCCSPDRF